MHIKFDTPANSLISCGDVDKDGKIEIFVTGSNKLYAWKSNGDGFFPGGVDYATIKSSDCSNKSSLIVDVDEDDELEIIVTGIYEDVNSYNGYNQKTDIIEAIKTNGTPVPGWPIEVKSPILATPCIDDIDNDGKNEIVACAMDYIHVWDTEGDRNLNEWGMFRLNTHNNAVYDNRCLYNENEPYIVSGTEIWTDIKVLQSDIIVPPASTLEIRGTVKMPIGSKIIVQRAIDNTGGGTLLINGGTITSACNGLWEGIEVWGHPDQEQMNPAFGNFNQGRVCIYNHGTVKNAIIGVKTLNTNQVQELLTTLPEVLSRARKPTLSIMSML